MLDESLFSVNQVSLILKVHHLTVRRYIKEGKLKAVKIGGNIRIPQSALDTFTLELSPSSYGLKKPPRSDKSKAFALDDPFFRLKGRGLHLKRFE